MSLLKDRISIALANENPVVDRGRIIRPGPMARLARATGIPVGEKPRDQYERIQTATFLRAIRKELANGQKS